MRSSRTGRRLLLSLLALSICLLLPASALAGDRPSKIDASVKAVIEATGRGQAVPVIVSAPQALSRVEARLPKGVKTIRLPLVGSLAAYLTPAEITRLAGTAFVHEIVADNPVFGFADTSSMNVTSVTIGMGSIAPPEAGGPTGSGVAVAILDSGIAPHPDLKASRVVGWKDFVNDRLKPYDDAGHGTFVAGLVGGDGASSLPLHMGGQATVQFRGVAPDADLVGVKVLDETGQGRASGLIAGIAWSIQHKDTYGIKVMNISIGGNPVGPIRRDPVARAVQAAWRQGIVVVCAAGNEGEFGPGGILSPGNDPFVITVGSSDTRQTADRRDDVVTYYSSIGPTLFDRFAKPDLVAPGNKIVSLRTPGSYIDEHFPENTLPLSSYAAREAGDGASGYVVLSGTSTSAPLVAGAAALMLSEDRTLSPDDVKLRLMRTADPLHGVGAEQQGAGVLDVATALRDDARAGGYALSTQVGEGKRAFTPGDYTKWQTQTWSKYGWTQFKATKFKWTKFKWTELAWTKFKWTKFKWTQMEWAKFKWTVLLQGQ